MDLNITTPAFTPGEAEQITGISVVRQGDFRRHGYLPSSDKHTRFDAYALAHLWAIALLGTQGIGPKRASEVADLIAAGIIYNALCHAYDEKLALKVHRKHSGLGGVIVARFFVLFPDGSDHFDKSVDDALERGKRDRSVPGAIVVLDQRELGKMLVERAGRPLVHVEVD